MVVAEPVVLYSPIPFNETPVGCAFFGWVCSPFNYSSAKKKPELLRSDLDFCAVVENECDAAIFVDDGFFDHHHPDGIVPSVHPLRLTFQSPYKKPHCLVLLTEPGAFRLQTLQFLSGGFVPCSQAFVFLEVNEFKFTYDDCVQDALVEGYDQNVDFYTLLLNNEEIRAKFANVFMSEIYRILRNDAPAE